LSTLRRGMIAWKLAHLVLIHVTMWLLGIAFADLK
jgi:hypothetical protein